MPRAEWSALLRTPERPRLWIIAGPNGSDKSTLYDSNDIEDWGRSVWIINPDLLTARIRDREGMSLQQGNGAALDRIQAWLQASIDACQTIGVETVLSTIKYRGLVQQAKTHGFEFRLLYVTLQTADMNVERVKQRVARGGHNIDEEKIRARREKSFQQLPWFLDQADMAFVYDNSGAELRVLARKSAGLIEMDPTTPAEIRAAIESLGS